MSRFSLSKYCSFLPEQSAEPPGLFGSTPRNVIKVDAIESHVKKYLCCNSVKKVLHECCNRVTLASQSCYNRVKKVLLIAYITSFQSEVAARALVRVNRKMAQAEGMDAENYHEMQHI
jgi:hypothetical protein